MGSEMCIRDRSELGFRGRKVQQNGKMIAATMLVYSASFTLPQDFLYCHGEVWVIAAFRTLKKQVCLSSGLFVDDDESVVDRHLIIAE